MEIIKSNIRDFFSGLTFREEDHKYFVNGVPILQSVSTKLDKFHRPFEEYRISMAISENTGVPQEDILKKWHNKRDKTIFTGKKAHLFGELYTFNRELRPATQYDIAIMKFWKDLPSHIIPVFAELQMFHKEYLYAGTADTILFNTLTKKFIITDYKTNEDLFKQYKTQKMLGRFSLFADNNFNKYQIQLSYYKILFEQTQYEVEAMKIVWAKPDGNYELFNVQDFSQYLK
jgi:hypothetical protein